jgi:putative transposase
MIIHKSRRYELKPNKTQRMMFARTAGCTRYAYNWGLAKAKEIKEATGKFPKSVELSRMLTLYKQEPEFVWLKEVQAVPLFNAIKDLDYAFKRFYKKQNKFPVFKKKGVHDSFRIARNTKETQPLIKDERHVRVPIIGIVKTKEKIAFYGTPLNATISREADRWYISIACEVEVPEPLPVEGDMIGIDVGLTIFATLSDGTKIDAPKPLNKYLKKLGHLQRQHSKKQKGSNNKKKSAMKIAKLHQKIKNIRKDFSHKLSTELAKTKQLIAVEDLNVKGMVQNKHLSRHISDVGWSQFITMLDYKTHWYGSQIIKIDRWYPSSKTCSVCGYKADKMPLSVREWICPECGTQHDRDINAAQNILKIAVGANL